MDKKRLFNIFVNIGTSGRYKEKSEFGMSDYLIRYVLLNFIILFGVSILTAFSILNFKSGRYFTTLICTGMILSAITSFILARTKIRQFIPALILMIFYGLLCIMVTWVGEAEGANFLFIYMYPSLTIMLLGMRNGTIMSVIVLALVSVEMFIPNISHYNYTFDFSIRMLVSYILVFSVMTVIEITRKTKDRLIEAQNRELQKLKEDAETASRTKSNFLASMSHEIRTPMNAILGMTELLLRKELHHDARSNVQDIKQAGANLISIINDVLDFSKIEAGKLEIITSKYLLASLVNDTVNIIRTRLNDRPIRFFTNIDGKIPNSLIGDEVRLRQILLNLLSNAAKYTEKGYISLSITMESQEEKQVWLKFSVTDTGKGIKPEDQKKLFDEFVQVDTKKNRSIEGTGLGLAIVRRLCYAMGGDISVESEYGKGSVFTVRFPQGIESNAPFAAVDEPSEKKVLVYEGRIVYANSVCWCLENMNVPYTMVTNLESFDAALYREEWFYVFSGYGLYERIKTVMEKPGAVFPGGKKPPLALMTEHENEIFLPDVRFISLPVQSLSIANILNGKTDTHTFIDSSLPGGIRYTFPDARLLVVDDIPTNLKIAAGLLSPYQVVVDSCLTGAQSIEMVKQNDYDIVFMDHMMPEMDGIEAAAFIRVWENERQKKSADHHRQIPIIALTANAVSGMREMFIEKGFNDFLAKPIDISKLDNMLHKWIPKEKRIRGEKKEELEIKEEEKSSSITANFPDIPGIDTEKGIAMTGGTEEGYRTVLFFFRKDVVGRLPLLQIMPDADDLPGFVTRVHALKSASASVGALQASAQAAELEAAGKTGDLALIQKKLNGFLENLRGLVKSIDAFLDVE